MSARAMWAMWLAGAALAVTPAVAGAQGRAGMRFAAMDANRDGVITRAEWRGSEQSFRVHDWNNDGVLSGDEVRPGARRDGRAIDRDDFPQSEDEYQFSDWTERGFAGLDHNRDGRITRDEWHFDLETFRRADHDRNGWVSRAEFLGTDDTDNDDDRQDLFRNLDANGDGRVTRDEWHGSSRSFDALDENRDGVISREEVVNEGSATDLFSSLDVNRNGTIERGEWHWSAASFDRRDENRDGRLSRQELGAPPSAQSAAYRAGYDRGIAEGRAAGREDRERNQGWDLEGQRELEQADSGYEPRMGSRPDYQAGYREGFRRGYREGYGPR